MVSEESLAFVDLMRKDDMDRRASNVRPQTNPDERGEQDQGSVTEEAKSESTSETGESAESNADLFQQEQEVITTPAVPVSEVALGAEPLQASISDSEQAAAAEIFQQEGGQPEPASLFTEPGPDAGPNQSQVESGADANAEGSATESGNDADPTTGNAAPEISAEAVELFQENGNLTPDPIPESQVDPAGEAEAAPAMFTEPSEAQQNAAASEAGPDPASESATSEPGASAEPPEIFTSAGQEAAPNSRLQDEGVRVTEISNLSGETTMLVPEDMTDFGSMLQRFDGNYRTPDLPVGDDIEFPEIQEEPAGEEPQSTAEFAEGMMAGFTQDLLRFERRGT